MWVKLDDEILDNPKILQVGVVGFAVYAAGIVYCGRNLTDGFVPWAKIGTLIDLSGVYVDRNNDTGIPDPSWGTISHGSRGTLDPPSPQKVVKELVACGLWTRVKGGYEIHDYLKYNPSRTQVLAARAKDAARKHRRENPGGNPDGIRTDSEDVPSRPAPAPVPVLSNTKNRRVSHTKSADQNQPTQSVPTVAQTKAYLAALQRRDLS